MKYLIVGDIHGKIEIVKEALETYGHVIFLGDMIDAFDRTIKNQLECLEMVREAVFKGQAQMILGNHELSYMYADKQCSGHNNIMQHHIDIDYIDFLKHRCLNFIYLDKLKILITHAGLDKDYWNTHGITLATLKEDLTQDCNLDKKFVYNVGFHRGGSSKRGGIFWCDEQFEFEGIKELQQIFGHSRGTFRIKNKVGTDKPDYCIDCLDNFKNFLLLDDETGEIEIIT